MVDMAKNVANDIVTRYVRETIPDYRRHLQHCNGSGSHFAQLSWGRNDGAHAGLIYEIVSVLLCVPIVHVMLMRCSSVFATLNAGALILCRSSSPRTFALSASAKSYAIRLPPRPNPIITPQFFLKRVHCPHNSGCHSPTTWLPSLSRPLLLCQPPLCVCGLVLVRRSLAVLVVRRFLAYL